MTTARRLIVSSTQSGFYHCVSRCVRRAWLCGEDPYTGQSFEHRKQWIENRIKQLASLFAVNVYAYAVMSNHLHVVLQVDPGHAQAWSDPEVARRWCLLFRKGEEDISAKVGRLQANSDYVGLCRSRLGDLSWFMRCLNEPIARRANAEDDCTGRFWQGRYKCQLLLDERAVWAAMAYVDLNPIRAGICQELEQSSHTSIQQRMDQNMTRRDLLPVWGFSRIPLLSMTTEQYIDLVRYTAQLFNPGKDRGHPPPTGFADFHRRRWLLEVKALGNGYWRAVGSVQCLIDQAKVIGQQWLKGIGVSRQLQRA